MKYSEGDLLMTKQGMAIRVRKILLRDRMQIDTPSQSGWKKFAAPISTKSIKYKIG